MSPRPFFDTNILVYAYMLDDHRNGPAVALLAEGGVVSVQVLNEFVDVARRKLRFDWTSVEHSLEDLSRLLGEPLSLTAELHRQAVEIARQNGLRIYDSLIVGAARAAGCRTLYSEDMKHGRVIDGVKIVNPFVAAA